jgi:prolyl-tRNA editing enzyme YbaK/EbsC (Cys-tRNA(Pro) deacylase)
MHPTAAKLQRRLGERGLEVTVEVLPSSTRTAVEAAQAIGCEVGGIPPLGHDRELETVVDESLRRFDTVWCAAGTPHAVFAVRTSALIDALGVASVAAVS